MALDHMCKMANIFITSTLVCISSNYHERFSINVHSLKGCKYAKLYTCELV